ncbi:putative carbohydrate esterase [Phytophthora cinnamomi]|uniref:putative carbohydrate esterase n=1 Tax=Phytophthora cinnamomi TaxID=4785 RepID=UPI003559F226|nr:putative carbohydrate esterase [Phytophthora cinnamomi]
MHGRMITKSNCRKHNTRPKQIHVNGMGYMWLRDPEHKQHRLVVIHYHGGVFAMSDPLQDVELANQTHTMLQQVLKSKYQLDVLMDVLLSNYRKSPENPFPIHDNDCLDVYKYVLKHENISPDHVIRSGDSAGAKISLANCMRMRDSTPELLPLGCLQYSPSVDFEEKGGDERTPDLSPINCDLRNLPPMFIQYGTLERFYEQGMRIIARRRSKGSSAGS